MSRIWTGLLALTGFCATACGSAAQCEGEECGCAAERQLVDGTCCTGFTRPGTVGCEPRTWAAPQTIGAPETGTADEAFVAIDANGHGIAAWVRATQAQVDSEVTIATEDPETGTWTAFEPGLGLEGFGTRPSLAAGPQGEAIVAWRQELTEDSRVHVTARDSDGTWRLPTDAEPLSHPQLANQPYAHIAASGEAFVVYNQFSEAGYGVAVAHRPAATPDAPFSRPSGANDVLSPAIQFSNAPRITTGENGDAMIAWYQSPVWQGDLVVYASRRWGSDGEFARPQLSSSISPSGGTIDGSIHRNPTPVMNDRGATTIVWTQHAAAGNLAVYLATFDGKRDWRIPIDIDDSFSTSSFDAHEALPLLTRNDELYIAWTQDTVNGSEVVVAHRTANGVFDEPGDAPTRVSTPGARAIDHMMASGPDGEAIIVWSESDGGQWRVMARARNAAADRWSRSVRLSTARGADALQPSVAIGRTGRTIVTWLTGPIGGRQVRTATLEVDNAE